LAYPIDGHRKGTYWLTYFRIESTRLSEFNRACQLNDNILRNLTLKVDPRLVDTLVAHASGKAAVVRIVSDDVPGVDDDDLEDASSDEESEETAEIGAKN
jgi:small subunit ribosomal protein S6